MPKHTGPRPENAEKYLVAKKLVDGGSTISAAAKKAGFSHGTYLSCLKYYAGKAVVPSPTKLTTAADAPHTATERKPRKASPKLVHLPVPESPASGDREVTVVFVKMKVSEIQKLFVGDSFHG
jgi:hypothetical protein